AEKNNRSCRRVALAGIWNLSSCEAGASSAYTAGKKPFALYVCVVHDKRFSHQYHKPVRVHLLGGRRKHCYSRARLQAFRAHLLFCCCCRQQFFFRREQNISCLKSETFAYASLHDYYFKNCW